MRAWRLRGLHGPVCGVGEYPRHVHEVAWDFGSVFWLASVHGDVYCHHAKFCPKVLASETSNRFDTPSNPFFCIILRSKKWKRTMVAPHVSRGSLVKGAIEKLRPPCRCHKSICLKKSELHDISFYGTIRADDKEVK